MTKLSLAEVSTPLRSYGGTLAAFLVTWLLCFGNTLWSMLEIWLRSDTYAHGILIFPISIYLIWRKRDQIAATPLQPSFIALPVLFTLVVIWYFANAISVNVVSQLAVILMLPVLVWLCCGGRLLKLLRFPLLYLLFAVPMGDNLVPWLQNITADITVAALQLSQIPVYREGLYLSTPTGLFLVAEACSGIRYLIASVALGTLYAYLTYTSRIKQLVFCLASIIVPILANGVRAYGIVLIASLTDMKHAVGVDHLIYGWLFFGVIIFIMFYIGGFFADKKPQQPVPVKAESRSVSPALLLSGIFIMLIPMLTNQLRPTLTQQPVFSITQLEQSLTPVNDPNSLPQFSGSSAQVAGLWQYPNHDVWLYTAFYLHSDDKKLIGWHNQPYEPDSWTPASSQRRQLQIGSHQLTLQQVDLRSASGKKRLLWYWYGSGDYWSANPYLITAMQALGKVLHISQHGSFYALSVYYDGDPRQASQILERVLHQQYDLLITANSAEASQLSLAHQGQQP
ncbi:exosortase A [Arsukibacterium sp.]|uniref:exosortase A n=1 Tax=Arsukibacterium sp. TaxID=1977258 RepID=UPI00299CDEDC|nr:exosortase A [Arsukibacterium sp.]MDX1677985.1 exosortase A [Arsukibacterium sp.]